MTWTLSLIGSDLALLYTAVHFQESIKKQCKQTKCGLFLRFSSVENFLCFQHGNQTYFLLSSGGYIMLYFVIHHCSLWVQKIRIQKFSAILKKSKVIFVLEVILFVTTKGFWPHLYICVYANVCTLQRTHERGNQLCFALLAWFAREALLARIAKTATGKTCTSTKHLFTWDWSVLKCWDTNVVFQRAIFYAGHKK